MGLLFMKASTFHFHFLTDYSGESRWPCLPGLQVLDLNALLSLHLAQELLLLPCLFQNHLTSSQLLLLQLLLKRIGSVKAKGRGETFCPSTRESCTSLRGIGRL